MKKTVMAMLIAAATMASLNAHAISHEYRARLAASGCTQVDEANGVCDTGASAAKQRYSDNSGECTQVQEANGDCEMTSRHRGGSYDAPEDITSKYQGEAVDAMQAQGWTRLNQEGTKWKKGSKHATLIMGDDGQVNNIVIR